MALAEKGLTKAEIIAELTKSPHGKLAEYTPIGLRAASEDPAFFARLVGWNARKGQIRDAKAALPVLALKATTDREYQENALAHLALLSPKELNKALEYAKDLKAPTRLLRRLVERYLRDREAVPQVWERTAVQHRAVLKRLYTRYRVNPAPWANDIVVKDLAPADGLLKVVHDLPTMAPAAAAAAVIAHKIPFLIARGALGKSLKDPDVLRALLQNMTPSELVNNAAALQKLGVRKVPALRALLEEKLQTLGTSSANLLKTQKAAEALAEDDAEMAEKFEAAQEQQLTAKGIEGNWLVLGDKSGSMTAAIEAAQQVAAVLARMVKGQVWLVFFDITPGGMEVTGKSLDEIQTICRGIRAQGGTSVGCGLQWMLERKAQIDGIAMVGDGGENSVPLFHTVYERYCKQFDTQPTVYWYRVGAPENGPMQWPTPQQRAGIDVQTFDLRQGFDYYSLPNLVQTMRVGRYQLLDEILAAPLLTLDRVLKRTTHLRVLAKEA